MVDVIFKNTYLNPSLMGGKGELKSNTYSPSLIKFFIYGCGYLDLWVIFFTEATAKIYILETCLEKKCQTYYFQMHDFLIL